MIVTANNSAALNFSKSADGLLPAIIQDAETKVVLMQGYMNAEALEHTLSTQRVTFFSRSKQRLWTKGESSGHFLDLIKIEADCDLDSLLIQVKPNGPVCHTGTDTCWDNTNQGDFLTYLEKTIHNRRDQPSEKSY
ncbi:MAG: phosphoribosyl-AMP cyclohydrolase, partial [Cyanobacteria bacterium J06649_11]